MVEATSMTGRLAPAGAVLIAWAFAAAGPAQPPTTASAPASRPVGIAAGYVHDRGIGRHPAVLLHEDFEGKTLFDKTKWSSISKRREALKLVRRPANVSGGTQALQITATLGQTTGGYLFRRFKIGHEKMHVRFCAKFDEKIDYIHHFVMMEAGLPPVPYPTGGAGSRPAGDSKFTVGIEPFGNYKRHPRPGAWRFYCYWWKMPRSRDGRYWGRGFSDKPYATPARNRWYSVEFMTRCNTPGKPDGELALWIDGENLAHHKSINWRSDAKLKLNALRLQLYVTGMWAKTYKHSTVFFDDVVVATQYIGPPNRPARPAR